MSNITVRATITGIRASATISGANASCPDITQLVASSTADETVEAINALTDQAKKNEIRDEAGYTLQERINQATDPELIAAINAENRADEVVRDASVADTVEGIENKSESDRLLIEDAICPIGDPVTITNTEDTVLAVENPGGSFTAPDGVAKNTLGDVLVSIPSDTERTIPDQVIKNSLGIEVDTFPANTEGIAPNGTIKDTLGNTIGIVPSGDTEVIGNATAKNSEGATLASIPAEGEGTISDFIVKNTAGTTVDTKPAGVIGIAPDVVITKYDGVTTISIPAGVPYSETTIEAIWAAINTATRQAFIQNTESDADRNLQKASQAKKNNLIGYQRTGQTSSFATGDDGFYQKGRGTDFLTLSTNNRFGNTNRFTAVDGTQTYTGGSAIDHVTNLEWWITPIAAASTWALSIAAAEASTLLGHTDWRIPSRSEMTSLVRSLQGLNALEYPPFNLTTFAQSFLTSTSLPSDTTRFIDVRNNTGVQSGVKSSSSSYFYLLCRDYYTD